MLFKNLTSGLIWEVTDPDHIKRCTNDSNYEEVKDNKATGKARITKGKSDKVGE
ncbi:hypothetical protein ABET51_06745 [Metabacillus fastidiosus]|uniref:hypothetical protein n=1 Tax=Metabacillus fastidiosus TaxID=1458 RepID=UPI003D2B39E7